MMPDARLQGPAIHVFGAPRSGGHFVEAMLNRGVCRCAYAHVVEELIPQAVPGTTMIRLYRRDVFRHALSHAVSDKYNIFQAWEFSTLSGDVKPRYRNMLISQHGFRLALANVIYFHSHTEHLSGLYQRSSTVFYEDVVTDPDSVLSTLGLRPRSAQIRHSLQTAVPVPTPLIWHRDVMNYQELHDLFQHEARRHLGHDRDPVRKFRMTKTMRRTLRACLD